MTGEMAVSGRRLIADVPLLSRLNRQRTTRPVENTSAVLAPGLGRLCYTRRLVAEIQLVDVHVEQMGHAQTGDSVSVDG